MKRHAEPVKPDSFHSLVMVGDLSHFPLDHFTTVVENVSVGLTLSEGPVAKPPSYNLSKMIQSSQSILINFT